MNKEEIDKEKIHNLLTDIKNGFREFKEYMNILYPLDQIQFAVLEEYIEQLEFENKAYKAEHNFNINKLKEVEHEKELMGKALDIQKVGWNEGAKLFAEKQAVIDKLKEESKQLEHDILTMSLDTGSSYSLKLIYEAEGRKKQIDEILEMLGEKK